MAHLCYALECRSVGDVVVQKPLSSSSSTVLSGFDLIFRSLRGCYKPALATKPGIKLE